jgi:hypothetical protein
LIYHRSAQTFKDDLLSIEPERKEAFDRLEKILKSRPKIGLPDTCLLIDGRTVDCFKQTIKLSLFSGRIHYTRSQLTAQYIFNNETVFVFNLYLSG